jgi:hypothetical protein
VRIFLSYASEQKAAAEAIAFTLRKRGHSVFLDKDDLPPGKSYDDQIQAAVLSTDLMVFLISPASVAKGRYTLTELAYARHRWRTPDNFVLPVMLEATPMADVPPYLKAVTIHEPGGNLAAETAFWVEQMRGTGYVTRMTGWFALAGLCSGLVYLGTSEGWFGLPDIPYVKFVGDLLGPLLGFLQMAQLSTNTQIVVNGLVLSVLVPAGYATILLGRLLVKAAWPRAVGAGALVGVGSVASIAIGSFVYTTQIAPYTEIRGLQGELEQLRKELVSTRKQLEEATGRPAEAEADAAPRDLGDLGRALELEWTLLRLRIGLSYGAAFALFALAAGALLGPALRASRRWFLTIATAAVVGGALYASTNSLQISFLVFHAILFAIIGYWLGRGQET